MFLTGISEIDRSSFNLCLLCISTTKTTPVQLINNGKFDELVVMHYRRIRQQLIYLLDSGKFDELVVLTCSRERLLWRVDVDLPLLQ